MITFTERYPEASGIVGTFLSLNDPRSAIEQINENYAHGGGWNAFSGFDAVVFGHAPMASYLRYPGDPNMKAKAWARLRNELVVLYDYDWCSVSFTDQTPGISIARLD